MGEHWRILSVRRRWIWLVLFVAIVLAAGTLIHLCGWFGRTPQDPNSRTTAEWFYCGRQVRRVVQKWFKSVETAPSRARIKDSYQTYLVIDTNEPAVWIEDSGSIRKDARMELPRSMKWRLYHRTPKGDNVLSGLVRLRFKYARQLVSEMFFLVGTAGTARYLSINFGPGTNSGGGWFKPWAFRMPGRYAWQDERQEQVRSVVVDEDEYERNMSLVQSASAMGTSRKQANEELPPIVKRNETRWLAVEKELYLETERQFSALGYDLTSIKVDEGPAMTAALARAEGRKLGWIDKIYRGRRTDWITCHVDLKIDYLGDDVWYVVSDPNRKRGNADKYLDMEFLVKAEGTLSRKERKEWTRKGRMAAKISPEQPSPWRATLNNGISVELIGICRCPSDGRQWWGPDGSILDYIPYYRTYTTRHGPDERAYEIACKVIWPDGMPQRGYSSGMTGRIARHTGGGLKDRFGDDSRFKGHERIYVFKQSTEKTTMMWVFGKGDKESHYIDFKNISLVPGKDFGFEIETRVKIRR